MGVVDFARHRSDGMLMSAEQNPSSGNMGTFKLQDVSVVLADTRAHVRTLMKSAFLEIGIRKILDAGRMDQIIDSLTTNDTPDLLICDAGMSNETYDLIRDVRHSEIGRNPFLCIIGITWEPNQTEVQRIIDAGVDTLLVAPFSPQQLFDRINALVTRRMPFVVTTDYVGPDRRNDRDESEMVGLLEVPNSLQAKAYDQFDAAYMDTAIAQAVGRVKTRRMEYHAIEVADAVAAIIQQLGTATPNSAQSGLDELSKTLKQLKTLAKQQELAHVIELTQATLMVVGNLKNTCETPSDNNIKLLDQLSLAIRAAFDPDQQDTNTVHDIAVMVGKAS